MNTKFSIFNHTDWFWVLFYKINFSVHSRYTLFHFLCYNILTFLTKNVKSSTSSKKIIFFQIDISRYLIKKSLIFLLLTKKHIFGILFWLPESFRFSLTAQFLKIYASKTQLRMACSKLTRPSIFLENTLFWLKALKKIQ